MLSAGVTYDLKLEVQPDTGIYMLKRGDAKSDGSKVVRVGEGAVTGATAVPSRTEVVLPPQATPAVKRAGGGSEATSRPATIRPPHLEGGVAPTGTTPQAKVRESIPIRFALASDIAGWLGGTAITTDAVGRQVTYRPLVRLPNTGVVELGDTINRSDDILARAKGGERYRLHPKYNPAAAYTLVTSSATSWWWPAGGGGPAPGGGRRRTRRGRVRVARRH